MPVKLRDWDSNSDRWSLELVLVTCAAFPGSWQVAAKVKRRDEGLQGDLEILSLPGKSAHPET